MAAIWGAMRQVTTQVLRQNTHMPYGRCHLLTSKVTSLMPSSMQLPMSRLNSYYNAYPKFDESVEPFTKPQLIRYGIKYKYYKGGLLPRPKGKLENVPLPTPRIYPKERDAWTQKKALFGQNDYIDILGDGTVHPMQLMDGPLWLRGFKGNEFQRIVRRLKFQGKAMQAIYPTRYHKIRKQLFYLYKKLNRRRHASFWSDNPASAGARHRRIHFTKF